MRKQIKTATIDMSDNLISERIPVSEFVVEDDGIYYTEYKDVNQHGKVIHATGKLILPKETFIAVYNAWIKNG